MPWRGCARCLPLTPRGGSLATFCLPLLCVPRPLAGERCDKSRAECEAEQAKLYRSVSLLASTRKELRELGVTHAGCVAAAAELDGARRRGLESVQVAEYEKQNAVEELEQVTRELGAVKADLAGCAGAEAELRCEIAKVSASAEEERKLLLSEWDEQRKKEKEEWELKKERDTADTVCPRHFHLLRIPLSAVHVRLWPSIVHACASPFFPRCPTAPSSDGPPGQAGYFHRGARCEDHRTG